MIDVAFEPRIDLDAVYAGTSQFQPAFPKKTDIWEATFGFQLDVGNEPTNTSGSSKIGVRFDSTPPQHVLQCRVNGFTFSRVSPYENWMQVREAAQQHWNSFATALGHRRVTRLAVRYINALNFPLPIADFSEYLVAAPRVPQELSQSVSGFLQRVVIEAAAPKSHTAVVTQAIENFVPGTLFTVVFDIDVFQNVDLDLRTDELWAILDNLRDAKNEIFFSHLSEKAVELFA